MMLRTITQKIEGDFAGLRPAPNAPWNQLY
jgi:hypothetical protein